MTKSRNVRSLDVIAENIHKLERSNIIAVGGLLLEAKSQCEHGDWLGWLNAEFDMSVTTAERRMNVATLSGKFPKLKNLKLSATTLYDLAEHDDEEDLPSIINELVKHATSARLSHRDADRIITIAIGRRRFGDYPDATLERLVNLELTCSSLPWYEMACAALKERLPDNAESAKEIVAKAMHDYHAKLSQKAKTTKEAKDILDGPPPILPSPSAAPERHKLAADTEWAETKPFVMAVKELQRLGTKPIERFLGMFSPDELRDVSDFLLAIADKDDQALSAITLSVAAGGPARTSAA
jgi:hypothetical protein